MVKETPEEMVRVISEDYGLKDPEVLSAMLKVPREEFVPEKYEYLAYSDCAIDIGFDQTISQPFTVAYMTYLLDLDKGDRVLEVGTGSGYQAAVLSVLCKEVYTVEINKNLAKRARTRLKDLGFSNVYVKLGYGEFGWKEKSPFDAIIVTAQLEEVPKELFRQLKEGGKLVAPVGPRDLQVMTRYVKVKSGIKKEEYQKYVFVPFVLQN